MKFEKLSENKIRVTLTMQDLDEKEIDFHVFMSNPIQSQSILLDMLEEAKKEVGFDPEDYNLKIEALSLADTNFIFTITKVIPEIEKNKTAKKRFTVKKKSLMPSSTQAVYNFRSFDDFCGFLQLLEKSNLLTFAEKVAHSISLYRYKENYYLLMEHISPEVVNKIKFYANITEFAKYITNSKVFASKLKECGTLIIKNNALQIGCQYFISKK